MNILIFVVTLLMVLSLMTYARLDVYRSSQTFQMLFSQHVETKERSYVNGVETGKFKTAKSSPKKSTGDNKDNKQGTPKVDASSRINISTLLPSKKEDEAQAQKQQQAATLLKNLMVILYADQPFFRKIQQERPTFMDDIVKGIIEEASQLPDNQKIKFAKDLANLKLADPDLNEVFYKMLHGASYKEGWKQEEQSTLELPSNGDEAVETDQSDEAMIAKEVEEFKSPKGYYSLLDFITVSPGSKVRIYLAPRQVLQAIYHDNVVDDIMRERQALHKQASADKSGSNKESLKDTFRNMFDSHKDALIDENTLDYSVSKTKPPK